MQIDKIVFLSGFKFEVYMYVGKLSEKKNFRVNYIYITVFV